MSKLPHENSFFKAGAGVSTSEVEQVVVYAPNGARVSYPTPSHDRDGWVRQWIISGFRVAEHRGRSLYLELEGV